MTGRATFASWSIRSIAPVPLSSGPVLHLGDLPTQLQNFHLQNRRPMVVSAPALAAAGAGRGPVMPLAQLEKQAILETLRKLNGDKLLAARLLGIGKTTLYSRQTEGSTASAPPTPETTRPEMTLRKDVGDQAN